MRVCCNDPARLWPSARAEVQTLIGLLPIIASSWTRSWSSTIVATNASDHGYSVCLKECEQTTHETLDGPVNVPASENAAQTSKARTAFFDQHRIGFDTREDVVDLDEGDDPTSGMTLTAVDNFAEVPLEVVEATDWKDVGSRRWRRQDEKEKRALTRGVEILASMRQLYQKRVALVDDMAAAVSFERRFSRNFLVLTCIRKLALCLALDLAVTVRWIPSEANISDRPSRTHDLSDNRHKTVTDLLTTMVENRKRTRLANQ